jgi:hypothetical protein
MAVPGKIKKHLQNNNKYNVCSTLNPLVYHRTILITAPAINDSALASFTTTFQLLNK